MQKKWLAPLVLVVAIASCLVWFFSQSTAVVKEVLITDSGFVPTSLDITVGETVRFVNQSGRDAWPASDSHPSHGIWLDFDPRKSLLDGESWEFTFDRLGSWSYHDHEKSNLTGVINVYSQFGASSSECLERNGGSSNMQDYCWLAEFKSAHAVGGFDLVFAIFKEYQANDEVFQRNCHDVMHLLGKMAYGDYVVNGDVFTQLETSYCSYGFYHGFIEAMLAKTGDHHGGRLYCEQLRDEGEFYNQQLATDAHQACVHGFGHAIFDSLDGSLWGKEDVMVDVGLDVCQSIFSEIKDLAECGTGIWNALAIAYIQNLYEISFSATKTPFWQCERISNLYKPGCYIEMTIQYSHWNKHDQETDWSLMLSQESFAQPLTFEAYVSDAVQWRLPYDYEVIADYGRQCFTIEDREVRFWCMRGIHHGILKKTSPFTNQQESEKVCDLYESEDDHLYCLKALESYRKI